MSEIANIPWSLILPVLVLQLILMVVALVDVIRHQRTNGPFILWIFIILLLGLIGPILYFIFGRKQA
ncbi:PLDc N-terminal domain-containing protein [Sporosarcina luteola]|uniref:PLDc N-terminal domain-containing protein n=1 Tax=Sporosarcina luteola TaxID=582850 RepID=UPI002042488F|nr:PLDc N-terminal domain-containing protein [Sporosarcina luteola]MCM3744474.1 PLDc N-terminal domain-containing protein [Sporosarcina luteola]